MNNHNLVDLKTACPGIVVDMRYATERNFFKVRLYDGDSAWLLATAARKLAEAAHFATKRGLTLLVLDAYRPLSVQARMWDILPKEGFVAPPSRGSNHNRGAAVDVSLADANGRELPMPSEFDEFSERASHAYSQGDPVALRNRDELRECMEHAGFRAYVAEWWHYNDPEALGGPLLDITLSALEASSLDNGKSA
ncbi:MAG: M15 family metallopeptidase [Spirochaetia bacterium]|jgi:D-alanyl-D-alanine dipeptidase|nr:M15 family metallopeptidase [Spirochaetia bacterium]